MAYKLTVSTESTDRLDLRGLCEQHIAELWIPDHFLPHEAADFALDHFKRVASVPDHN